MAEIPAFSAEGLSVRFGGIQALAGVSFSVAAGEVLGVIGPNGSGKSTLLNCLSGVVRQDGGRIALGGERVERSSPHRRARLGIRRTFQQPALFEAMSVRNNVLVAAEHAAPSPAGAPAVQRVDAVLEEFGLRAFADTPVAALSTGYRRRVDLARALAGNPRLLLLDEPLAGVHPPDAAEIISLLSERRRGAGITMMIVAHEFELLAAFADRLLVLDFGRVIATGTTVSIRADPAVRAAYVGGAA